MNAEFRNTEVSRTAIYTTGDTVSSVIMNNEFPYTKVLSNSAVESIATPATVSEVVPSNNT